MCQSQTQIQETVSFCDLFDYQVNRNPGAIAAIYEDESITYKELDQRSTEIAAFLNSKGVCEKSVVGLCFYNSIDLVVGMLSIFKAGGIYLPIDPNYPMNRIQMMTDDANPELILTSSDLKKELSGLRNLMSFSEYRKPVGEKFSGKIKPENLAYIVFTSGSTGKPKGILVDHKALAHAVRAYSELHPEKPTSIITGSISFDPSLLVMVHTLSLGGTLCFPNNKGVIDPSDLNSFIHILRDKKCTFMLCTPFLYSLLLDKIDTPLFLKNVDLCGEEISPHIPVAHSKLLPHANLHNVYGPSEYAMGVTAAKIYDPDKKSFPPITIGKPFSSENYVYLLDDDLKPVPKGSVGEIFVGGPGIAKGYIKNEKLTYEKFVFLDSKLGGKKVYRTGDYGSLTKSGEIVFLGRKDNLIKFYGHTVELNEIDATIQQHPSIKEVKSKLRKDPQGKDQLVSFFDTIDGSSISEEIKSFLSERLPSYMIPSLIIQVDKWPCSPNGKTDMDALLKCC